MKGGKREGSGRKLGSKVKKTSEVALRAAVEGITPLEYMLNRMRDENELAPVRADMAKAAAPYVHPRLAAVEHTGKDGGAIQTEDVSKIELARWLIHTLKEADDGRS